MLNEIKMSYNIRYLFINGLILLSSVLYFDLRKFLQLIQPLPLCLNNLKDCSVVSVCLGLFKD